MGTRFDYEGVYSSAKAELEELQKGKALAEELLAEINERMEALSITMRAVDPLRGKPPFQEFLRASSASPEQPQSWGELVGMAEEYSVTESIREVLSSSSAELSAPEIKDKLQSRGWKVEDYRNPLAFIHTVLKRLMTAAQVKEIPVDGGKKYRWVAAQKEKKPPPRTVKNGAASQR